MKEKIKIGGITYRYVKPEDFTFRQFQVGKSVARRIMPILKEQLMLGDASGSIEIDAEKILRIYQIIGEIEENVNETDIIALCYIPEKPGKFNLDDYEKLKNDLLDVSEKEIKNLRECIPDFFSYILPRLAEGILTSIEKRANTNGTPEKSIENIAEKKA